MDFEKQKTSDTNEKEVPQWTGEQLEAQGKRDGREYVQDRDLEAGTWLEPRAEFSNEQIDEAKKEMQKYLEDIEMKKVSEDEYKYYKGYSKVFDLANEIVYMKNSGKIDSEAYKKMMESVGNLSKEGRIQIEGEIGEDGARKVERIVREQFKEKVTEDFSSAQDFESIIKTVDKLPGIQGSSEYFDNAKLKNILLMVHSGQVSSSYVTNTYGLRNAIDRVMLNEKRKTEANEEKRLLEIREKIEGKEEKAVGASEKFEIDLDYAAPEMFQKGGEFHEYAKDLAIKSHKEAWKQYVLEELAKGRTAEEIKNQQNAMGRLAPKNEDINNSLQILFTEGGLTPEEVQQIENEAVYEAAEEYENMNTEEKKEIMDDIEDDQEMGSVGEAFEEVEVDSQPQEKVRNVEEIFSELNFGLKKDLLDVYESIISASGSPVWRQDLSRYGGYRPELLNSFLSKHPSRESFDGFTKNLIQKRKDSGFGKVDEEAFRKLGDILYKK